MAAAAATAAIAGRQQILARFPGPLSFSFAYGSGVKQQLGYADLNQPAPAPAAVAAKPAAAAPMIDLILCVDDTARFHRANLARNPNDYSSLARRLGAAGIDRLQSTACLGAGVYFNPLVPLADGRLIKYGVVSADRMRADLLQWRHLYVAGRLHKPVEVLQQDARDERLAHALAANLEAAVRCALLCRLPAEFGYFELFHAVATLSYAGDFRMWFGERKDKVQNIVAPQLLEFRRLYAAVLERMQRAGVLRIDDEASGDVLRRARIAQCQEAAVLLEHVRALPVALREALDDGDVERMVRERPDEVRRLVRRRTERIVWNSSWGQSLKNVPTAGVGKAVRYSWQKVRKQLHL